MELVFEGEGRLTPLADESIDGIERFLIPWFEPSGVMLDEELIFDEFFFYIHFSWCPMFNGLSRQPTWLVAGKIWQ